MLKLLFQKNLVSNIEANEYRTYEHSLFSVDTVNIKQAK